MKISNENKLYLSATLFFGNALAVATEFPETAPFLCVTLPFLIYCLVVSSLDHASRSRRG